MVDHRRAERAATTVTVLLAVVGAIGWLPATYLFGMVGTFACGTEQCTGSGPGLAVAGPTVGVVAGLLIAVHGRNGNRPLAAAVSGWLVYVLVLGAAVVLVATAR